MIFRKCGEEAPEIISTMSKIILIQFSIWKLGSISHSQTLIETSQISFTENEFVTFDFWFFCHKFNIPKSFVIFQIIDWTRPGTNRTQLFALFPTKAIIFGRHFSVRKMWLMNWKLCFSLLCIILEVDWTKYLDRIKLECY